MSQQVSAATGEDAAALGERIVADVRHARPRDGRLPTERQLAAEHQVSRTTVRRALARLEAAGVVSRQVGRGTFLRSADELAHRRERTHALTDVGPSDVMAARLLLEPHAMALVVARATARDFTEMDRCLRGGDGAEDYDEFEAWDLALHRCLIAAAHNPLIVGIYAQIEKARHGLMWGQLKRRRDSVERRRSYCREHHAIVDAVRSRDEYAAVRAMRQHLTSVSASLFGTAL